MSHRPNFYPTIALPGSDDYLLSDGATRNTNKVSFLSLAQQVSTQADLKALSVSGAVTGATVRTRGSSAVGDGGAQTFYYDSTSVAADNGTTVLQPNAGSGRWLAAGRTCALTGDVTGSGDGSIATTIANGSVTLAKMASTSSIGVFGSATSLPAVPQFLSMTTLRSLLSISNVENTALSTWAGSANITTLGTITTGTWHGAAIADGYISSAATWNSKEPAITSGTTAQYWRGDKSWQTLDSASVGLGAGSTPQFLRLGLGGAADGTYQLKVYGVAQISGAGSAPYLRVTNTSNSLQGVVGELFDSGSFGVGTVSNHDTVIYANNSEVMRAKSGGNVGIGTVTPGERLDIGSGNFKTTGSAYASGGYYNASGSVGWNHGDGTYFSIRTNTSDDRFVVVSSGNVGIGMTNPATYGAKLGVHVGTDMNLGIRDIAGIGGTGTGPALDATTDNAGSIQNLGFRALNFQFLGGNVGIGTTNPVERLQVHAIYDNPSTGLMIDATDTSDPEKYNLRVWPYVLGAGMVGYKFQTKSASGGTNLPLAFDHAGNVGIGTAAPSALLHVNGTIKGLNIDVKADQIDEWLTNTDTAGININYDGYNGGTTRYRDLTVYDGKHNAVMMVDGSSASVGIGTVAPETRLHVVGPAGVTSFTGATRLGATITGSTGTTDYSGIDFSQTTANPLARIGAEFTISGSFLRFGTSNAYGTGITNTAMSIDYAGNVGIGVASPTASLHVRAGTATAGTAPIKLTSGTSLTTPEAGTIEYDGSFFYLTV